MRPDATRPGQRDRVHGDQQQREHVQIAEQNQGQAVPGNPRPPGILGHPQQQVAGRRRGRDHHRVRAGVVPLHAGLGQGGEQQPGAQGGAAGHQPPGDRRDPESRRRHRQRRRQPGRHLTGARDLGDRPEQQVVQPVHGVDVAEHPDQLGQRAGHRRDRVGLVAPVGRPVEPPQHDGEGRGRGSEQRPVRPAGGPPDVRDSRDRTGEKADRHATGLRNRAYRDGKASAYPPFIPWRG